VVGVAANPPANSHIQFDMLLPVRYNEMISATRSNHNWDSNNYHTYIRLQPDAGVAGLGRKLEKYLTRNNPGTKTTLHLQPLLHIYLHSNFAFQTDWSKTSSMMYIRIFGAVGLVVLLIAVFNFINLATARAVQRAREVGVRKVVGAFRGQLVVQFLGESLLMTGLATGLALLLLQGFLPLLNDIAVRSLLVPYRAPLFWLAIGAVTALVGLLAGIYPAFYLSRFRPVRVLKGVFDVQSGQLFRRTLVVSQFTLSITLVIGAIVIYTQLRFLQDKDLGFDRSQLVQVRLRNQLREKAGLFKTDLERQASIVGVTATSDGLVNLGSSTAHFGWEGQPTGAQLLITHFNADPDFLSITGMKLVAGRNFDARITTDTASAYLVNETAAKRMGWKPEEALGKKIRFWDREGSVIGVVQDFHFRPLTTAIEPFIFRYKPGDQYFHLVVKTHPGQTRQALAGIERFYKKYEQLTAPQYEFVDEALENQYRAQQRTGRVVLYFSVLAIFVSCLGLLGLATFTAEQRTREIGVRKVLGASVGSIVRLLSKDFLKLVLVAIVIASPVAWYAAHQWLQDFAYKIAVQWWMFAGAGLLAVGIALLTVSYQAIRTALINPVKSLRTE
jgi:ABC-type lipoprotein release transport system permease subunit